MVCHIFSLQRTPYLSTHMVRSNNTEIWLFMYHLTSIASIFMFAPYSTPYFIAYLVQNSYLVYSPLLRPLFWHITFLSYFIEHDMEQYHSLLFPLQFASRIGDFAKGHRYSYFESAPPQTLQRWSISPREIGDAPIYHQRSSPHW